MTVLPYTPCRCERQCERRERAPETVCPCPECQPGPGLNLPALRRKRRTGQEARMRTLLARPELTQDEAEELDGLLHLYIHS